MYQDVLTVHPAFLHFLGLQTPAEGGCLELEQSEEKYMICNETCCESGYCADFIYCINTNY